MTFEETNQLKIRGTILEDLTLNHEIYGEKFYAFTLGVKRYSGVVDEIPVIVSERLLIDQSLKKDDFVEITGQFRSRNNQEAERFHLQLFVFAKNIDPFPEDDWDYNEVQFVGYICKEVNYRTTPFGREVSDILLAVNRSYNKSDYIPIIAWGRNARYAKTLSVGTKIEVKGRIQSRKYMKTDEEGQQFEKIAYEVSADRLMLGGEDTTSAVEETE